MGQLLVITVILEESLKDTTFLLFLSHGEKEDLLPCPSDRVDSEYECIVVWSGGGGNGSIIICNGSLKMNRVLMVKVGVAWKSLTPNFYPSNCVLYIIRIG